MSTDDLLARLARLDDTDRTWLLSELPPALRRELASMLANDEAAVAEASPASGEGWESIDAAHVAQVLEQEPVWLISAATRNSPADWRESLLKAMSARRRHDVEAADRQGRPLGVRAASLVMEECRARVRNSTPVAARRGFAALVDQMRSRFA